jgi:hypothetical protein
MPKNRLIKNNKEIKRKVQNRNELIKDFLSIKIIKKEDTIITKNSIITMLGSNELNTNYYKLQCKKHNQNCFFIKEINNAKLIKEGNQGYNEYIILNNKKFKEISKLFGFEVIEPYIGYVDFKKKKSYIVTPYKELITIDDAFKKNLISRQIYRI